MATCKTVLSTTICCVILIGISIIYWFSSINVPDLIGFAVDGAGVEINDISFTRSIAEFDKMKSVLIRYPFGIPMQIIIEILNDADMTIYCLISSKYSDILNNIFPESVDMERIEFIIAETDSYWTRDYGPFFVHSYLRNLNGSSNNIGIVDFKYNRDRPNDNAIAYELSLYFNLPYINKEEIQNTGGNYMTDGCDVAASTQIIYTENDRYCNLSNQTLSNLNDPTLPSCAYIDNVMKQLLGIEHFSVFQDPNKDYIDHIDCWSKFLSEKKILIKKFNEKDERYNEMEMIVQYWQNTMNSFNQKWKIYRVYAPNDEPYTNSFILNNKVFVPLIDDESSFVHNENAMKVYKKALPNYKIIGFYSNGSIGWLSTDAIHCRLKGIPDFDYILKRTHDLCEHGGGTNKSSGFQWNSLYVYTVYVYTAASVMGVALIGFVVWCGFKAVVGSKKQKNMKQETQILEVLVTETKKEGGNVYGTFDKYKYHENRNYIDNDYNCDYHDKYNNDYNDEYNDEFHDEYHNDYNYKQKNRNKERKYHHKDRRHERRERENKRRRK